MSATRVSAARKRLWLVAACVVSLSWLASLTTVDRRISERSEVAEEKNVIFGDAEGIRDDRTETREWLSGYRRRVSAVSHRADSRRALPLWWDSAEDGAPWDAAIEAVAVPGASI